VDFFHQATDKTQPFIAALIGKQVKINLGHDY